MKKRSKNALAMVGVKNAKTRFKKGR